MPRLTPAQLFVAFLLIGLQGFGGVLPWARRVLVDERRWLTAEQFLEQWSLCQALPGGNITNLSVALGLRSCGPLGSLAALGGLVSGPFTIICVLGYLYTHYGAVPYVEAMFRGISAAGAGLVVATGLRMAASPRMRSPLAVFALAAFVLTALLRWPLLAVLAILLPLCMLGAWASER
jgi:chromate transporter